MSKIYVVGDPVTVTGLKLAGMKNAVASTPQELDSVLAGLDEAGIMVITHSLYQHAKEKIERMHDKIVIELPDRRGGGDDVVNRIIRDVVGFEMG